jgi:3-methyl-2-oxobutanoate hydroxymethyltransferase
MSTQIQDPTKPQSPSPAKARKKVTVRTYQAKHDAGEPITMVTAYDYPTAQLAQDSGIDSILVGDSLAMVVLGHDTTLSVTMDEMIHHAKAVRRGASTPLLVGDLPFMSYQVGPEDALRNAGRFLQEAGMDAVKLEGGRTVVPQVRAIVGAGIPVMGHVGLTPQSIHALGGWRVQGRTPAAARELLADALALQAAGCFSIVLESVPERLATYVAQQLDIPTIGIGAGPNTSGQVLVIHDLLGLFDRFQPKFVKRYALLGADARAALGVYRDEVATRAFPNEEHSYTMTDEAWSAFLAEREEGGTVSLAPAGAQTDDSTEAKVNGRT